MTDNHSLTIAQHLAEAVGNVFLQASHEDFRTNGAGEALHALSTTLPRDEEDVGNIRDVLLSNDTPQARKLVVARGYIFASLCCNVGLSHSVGMTAGKIELRYGYNLDLETSKSVLKDIVDWLSDLGLGVTVSALTREGGTGVDGFRLEWHDIPRAVTEE